MIATATTTATEQPQNYSSSDAYLSSLSSSGSGTGRNNSMTITSLRLLETTEPEEKEGREKNHSNSDSLQEQILQSPIHSSSTDLSLCQSPDSNVTLTSSPKIGKWSEGSSYPSGFGIRIDSRSHLEVFDQKHRYGKNLRLYYKEWVHQKIELQFFDWLASPSLTELPDCPRAALDEDTVFYCKSDVERDSFIVRIGTNGKFYHRVPVPVTQAAQPDDLSSATASASSPVMTWKRLTTHGEGNGWIFVLRDNRIYAHEKITDRQPRFHHSSFFAGADVDAAGMFVIEEGQLLRLFPHSGHYRPGEVHMYFLLHFLDTCGVRLCEVACDAQRLAHVARRLSEKGGKARKIDTPCMWPGDYMLNFLRSKKLFWDLKIATGLKSHPLSLSKSLPSSRPSNLSLLSSSASASAEDLPTVAAPALERRSSNSAVVTPSAPYYASGTFGGGGIGKPLLLIPAISTYPLTAALRDELLNRVKLEQQQQQAQQQSDDTDTVIVSQAVAAPVTVTDCKTVDEEEEDSQCSADPKDAGVLSAQTTNG